MIGKISPKDLERFIFTRLGAKDGRVLVGPSYGEDSCAIDLGNCFLVASSDPIIFAEERIGNLGVSIACNDVAASGAMPMWILPIYYIPEDGRGILDEITKQVDYEARRIGVSVVGGHTEIVPGIKRPLISMTCLGTTKKFVRSSGAREGNMVILTKSAAIEGTGIIATDFKEKLMEKGITEEEIAVAEGMLDRISVVEDAMVLREFATSMHDPTEGGVLAGAYEMAVASGVSFDLRVEDIPLDPVVERICGAMGIDPLRIFASGALLATVPRELSPSALKKLDEKGVKGRVIGVVKKGEGISLMDKDGGVEKICDPEMLRDEMYGLWPR